MEPLNSPEIVFHGLLDLREFLLQLRIVVHPFRLAAVAMARDASRVTLPTDRTSFIALPMPDAASPASTNRRGAHESAQGSARNCAGHVQGENVDAREKYNVHFAVRVGMGLRKSQWL